MIRKRLYRYGVDLDTQERNQKLAELGSKTQHLATIDFSSASDSIAKETVRALLPERWFFLLDTCRSHSGRLPDATQHRWEKFSSMGNGFTFELESLIFFAAAKVVCEYLGLESEVAVFGDDVILPTAAAGLFSSFCDYLGFRINQKKSFLSPDGWFRESCGSYYYKGVDVKPIFLKEGLSSVESFYRLANKIRVLAHRRCYYSACDRDLRPMWQHLFEAVPEQLRFLVPISAGDVGFVCNFDEARPQKARNCIEGYFYVALCHIGITRFGEEPAMLHLRLRNRSDEEYGNNYTLRGRTRRCITKSLVPQWYNLGSWE